MSKDLGDSPEQDSSEIPVRRLPSPSAWLDRIKDRRNERAAADIIENVIRPNEGRDSDDE